MTRVEENEVIRKVINDKVKSRWFSSWEEKSAFQLAMINLTLSDISKSLAVIADKMSEEE